MKIQKLACPNCGAGIDIDLKGKSTIFCPFCGMQLVIKGEDVTTNINNNQNILYINKSKHININRNSNNNIVNIGDVFSNNSINFISSSRKSAQAKRKRFIKRLLVLILIAALCSAVLYYLFTKGILPKKQPAEVEKVPFVVSSLVENDLSFQENPACFETNEFLYWPADHFYSNLKESISSH